MMFDVLPDILVEPFPVYTLMGHSVVAKRVYQSCPIILSNSVTLINSVELDRLDFDFMLVMNWSHACFALN